MIGSNSGSATTVLKCKPIGRGRVYKIGVGLPVTRAAKG